ncbi:hypothetical protein K3165_11780 [Qipengyuania sp. 1XM1-15A]|uniref:hypothetical protein n=1 Tax=Qipengyuania xiamenensis TaxID=2867237 RepID=UPI001C86D3F8|nr:hypothetical protein [Qipengyuania xiamenensis]MBX7533604.1 hypothetical protein [Qipengyuania xiamenensis]
MGLAKEEKANHVTDRVSDAVARVEREVSGETTVPGPSPNPATNLLIHEIILRSAGRLTRHTVEKALLGRKYGSQFAKEAVENRSIVHTLAAYGVTKYATKSVPGALIVGLGLVGKTLFDRSQSRRKARRKGEKTIRGQADGDTLA